MSKTVAAILKTAQQTSAVNQPLQVAAYCRVSTKQKEQQRSLEAQLTTIQDTSKTIPIGYWWRSIPILHLALALINALATSSS